MIIQNLSNTSEPTWSMTSLVAQLFVFNLKTNSYDLENQPNLTFELNLGEILTLKAKIFVKNSTFGRNFGFFCFKPIKFDLRVDLWTNSNLQKSRF